MEKRSNGYTLSDWIKEGVELVKADPTCRDAVLVEFDKLKKALDA